MRTIDAMYYLQYAQIILRAEDGVKIELEGRPANHLLDQAIEMAVDALRMKAVTEMPLSQSAMAAMRHAERQGERRIGKLEEKGKPAKWVDFDTGEELPPVDNGTKGVQRGSWAVVTSVDNPLVIGGVINALSKALEKNIREHGPMRGLRWIVKEIDWRNVIPLDDGEDEKDELAPLAEGVCPEPEFVPEPYQGISWSIGWKAEFGGK